jgi:hypothetical protein
VSPTTRWIVALAHRSLRRDQRTVKGASIAGMDNTDRVRQVAQSTIDELFVLMSRRAKSDQRISLERLQIRTFSNCKLESL